MREDPVFSGGIIKLVGVILVAAVLGVGAYALFGDGIDFPDLPDLPDVENATTTLQNTDLSDTTIDPGNEVPAVGTPPAGDPYTTEGFASAIDTLRDSVGPNAELTRLFINGTIDQFIVRRGDGIEAYSVRSDTGELTKEDATISISGGATIKDFAFPLAAVKPQAIDTMLTAARKQSGAKDFEPTVLTLERHIPFGSRALEWTINASGNGHYLLYRADPDGGNVRNEGGEGPAIPQAAKDAKDLTDCIEAANQDPNEIFACLDKSK